MFTVNYTNDLNASLQDWNNGANDKDDAGSNMIKKRRDWNMLTATQMVIFLLFVFGIFFAILMYCKICSRGSEMRYSEHRACENNHDDNIDSRSLHSYSIYDRVDRPPSYSEACSAPPLYDCPFNRVSMLEAPPVYPETPKAPERVSHLITNHI